MSQCWIADRRPGQLEVFPNIRIPRIDPFRHPVGGNGVSKVSDLEMSVAAVEIKCGGTGTPINESLIGDRSREVLSFFVGPVRGFEFSRDRRILRRKRYEWKGSVECKDPPDNDPQGAQCS